MFDAHAHLQFQDFDDDLDEVLDDAARVGVRGIILADFDRARRGRLTELARRPGIWRSVGLHPWALDELTEQELGDELELVAEAARTLPVCAIGETGLDFFRAIDEQAQRRQVHAFRAQLELAREVDHPVVIHSVRANHEILAILRSDGAPSAGGMMHSFRGSSQEALEFVALGLDISISTSLLRGNAGKLKRVVEQVPLASLLVETDSPDQAPDGGRNVPANVVRVVQAVAEIRGVAPAIVGHVVEENARRRFRLGDESLRAI